MSTDIRKQFDKVIKQYQSKYKDITPVLEKIRRYIEQYIARNFDSGGRWDGSGTDFLAGGNQRWKPLADSTKKSYKKLGYELVATLNRNNGLRSSIGTQLAGDSGILITANSPYARIHQLGGTINHPARESKAKFKAKKNKKGNYDFRFAKSKAKGKNVVERKFRIKAYSVTMPARPYLTITPEEFKSLVDEFAKFGLK